MFRKMFLIICFFFFPFFVFASPVSDQYELIISEEFLDYMNEYYSTPNPDTNQEMLLYKLSGFSVRDYYLFLNCMNSSSIINRRDNVVLVSDVNHYYDIDDSLSFDLLEGYSSLKISFVDHRISSNKDFSLSSFDDFLNNSMLHYYLFRNYLESNDSLIEFQRIAGDSYYGKIVARNTSKPLLFIHKELVDDSLYRLSFHIPGNVTIDDNLSIVQFNSLIGELEYLPVVFSTRTFENEVINPKTFFNQWIVLLGILLLIILLCFLLLPISKRRLL